MPDDFPKAMVRAEAQRLMAFFEASGGKPVEADILQPAELLLDLYGEDIRGRAYVTRDSTRGEMMLRPDFTVPVVQMHMDGGADPARYTYAGEVFRRQEDESSRSSEHIQVGYEVFDRHDPARADAEVFGLFSEILSPLGLHAATGDIGILKAAVEGLSTTEARKKALLRHIWRPRRFRDLLDRFGGRSAVPASRKALLEAAGNGIASVLQAAGPMIGIRSEQEIAARVQALLDDAATPPLSSLEVEILDDILALRETCRNALEHLRDIAVDLRSIAPAVHKLEARLNAMEAHGVDVDSLDFEASYGRTTMEYYDGFVFGFYAEARPDLPPVASGGRYDALTQRLGHGRSIPAVGGIIRPALVLTVKEALA